MAKSKRTKFLKMMNELYNQASEITDFIDGSSEMDELAEKIDETAERIAKYLSK